MRWVLLCAGLLVACGGSGDDGVERYPDGAVVGDSGPLTEWSCVAKCPDSDSPFELEPVCAGVTPQHDGQCADLRPFGVTATADKVRPCICLNETGGGYRWYCDGQDMGATDTNEGRLVICAPSNP